MGHPVADFAGRVLSQLFDITWKLIIRITLDRCCGQETSAATCLLKLKYLTRYAIQVEPIAKWHHQAACKSKPNQA